MGQGAGEAWIRVLYNTTLRTTPHYTIHYTIHYTTLYTKLYTTLHYRFTSFAKKSRSTLLGGLYLDADMENAQYTIAGNLCEAHSTLLDCPSIRFFNEHREEVYTDTMTEYSVDRKTTKTLFLRLIFSTSNGFTGWAREHKIEHAQPTNY